MGIEDEEVHHVCVCGQHDVIKLPNLISRKKMIEIIKEYENPYPKDVFLWDNKVDMKITRGRFNEFIHLVVENTRNDLITKLMEEGKQ